MTNEHDLPPDLPAILSVQLAEQSVQTCITRGTLDTTAEAIIAEMRPLLYYTEDTDLEMLLAQQGQALNALFHRALTLGADKDRFYEGVYAINLAMDAQRHCRQTIDIVTRSRARRTKLNHAIEKSNAKSRKQSDSDRDAYGVRGSRTAQYDDPFAPHLMPGYKGEDD